MRSKMTLRAMRTKRKKLHQSAGGVCEHNRPYPSNITVLQRSMGAVPAPRGKAALQARIEKLRFKTIHSSLQFWQTLDINIGERYVN